MFPTGLPPSSPQMVHPHTLTAAAGTSASPPGRTIRLRGLAYLRSYTHSGHSSHGAAHSPAAPTVVTAANASTASAAQLSQHTGGSSSTTGTGTGSGNSSNSNVSGGNSGGGGVTGRRPAPPTSAATVPAFSSTSPSSLSSSPPPSTVTASPPATVSSSSSSPPPQTTAHSQPSNSSTSALAPNVWLPTPTGFNGLTRVATQPPAEISASSVTVANGHPSTSLAGPVPPTAAASVSVLRPRSDSLPLLARVRSIDEALAPPPPAAGASISHGPAVHAPAATTIPSPPSSTAAAAAAAAAVAATAASAALRVHTPGQMDPPAASIRFTPHIDLRSSREALTFSPIERILRIGDEIIRVGRYSERDSQPTGRDATGANTAPVGFKSKVVSRRHCEFWYENNQWYVKDVKSSSGTFLNHIRLSAPGVESRAFPIYDGDILQLGIDFKGGEEPIFRCVKIRVELNRAWQKGLNNFNMSAHKRIKNMAASSRPQGDTASQHTSECSICLMSIAPCQALFVAPCSHVWHFKCIRPLVDKGYPNFLCPNCRAIADLERDIEEDELGMFAQGSLPAAGSGLSQVYEQPPPPPPPEVVETEAPIISRTSQPDRQHHSQDDDLELDEDGEVAESAAGDDPTEIGVRTIGDETAIHPSDDNDEDASPNAAAARPLRRQPFGVTDTQRANRLTDNESVDSASSNEAGYISVRRTPENSGNSGNATGGPMTPRNDVGPFLFDGSARGRGRGSEENLVRGD